MFKKILICLFILTPTAVEAEEYKRPDGTSGTILECKKEREEKIREIITSYKMFEECKKDVKAHHEAALQEKRKAEISETLGQWTEAEKRWDNVRYLNEQVQILMGILQYWVSTCQVLTERFLYLNKICG